MSERDSHGIHGRHGIFIIQRSSTNSVFTAETHDCTDAGVRAMQGAIAERTPRNSLMETNKLLCDHCVSAVSFIA
jgi:hypothetical protein